MALKLRSVVTLAVMCCRGLVPARAEVPAKHRQNHTHHTLHSQSPESSLSLADWTDSCKSSQSNSILCLIFGLLGIFFKPLLLCFLLISQNWMQVYYYRTFYYIYFIIIHNFIVFNIKYFTGVSFGPGVTLCGGICFLHPRNKIGFIIYCC